MINIQQIREDFPILSRKIYNKDLVYLDNGATTQKPQVVLDALIEGYSRNNANIHRGVHYLSQLATTKHEEARQRVQTFLNATHAHEIIFTRGTTESINLVAFSFGEQFLHEGDEIILSEMEHHANIVPWQMLRDRKGIVLKIAPINHNQELDLDAFKALFTDRTKLVAITHVSNVLGTINPVKEIIDYAHDRDIPVLIDGAQSVPHISVDLQELDADFYVFSAHKVYGPNGIGILYGKEKWLNAMPPYQGGGEMIAQVTFEKTTYNELPFKFEAGTPDYIGSTGLAAALDYISAIGLSQIEAYEHQLLEYATAELLQIPGLRIIGNAKHKSAVISFHIEGLHHYDVGMLLDKLGIAVRTGHHCAQPLMQRLGIDGTIRASFSFYNTFDEINTLVAALKRIVAMF